ncbi:MAG: hypothetical protein ABIS38_05790, partial [Sphingomicrobium sp.]
MILLFAAAQALQPAAPAPAPAPAASSWPTHEGDAVLRNFGFRSGEVLPEVRMHWTTLGTPHRDPRGRIDNAVMVLH